MAKLPGSIWVEVNEFHFIDAFQREWYLNGIFMKNAPVGAKPGSFWMESTTGVLTYVNQAGTQIYRIPQVILKQVPLSAKVGSVWIGGERIEHNNMVTWVRPWDASQNAVAISYIYVPAVTTHSDNHVDTAHTDVIHSDIAHTDLSGGPHQDGHNDVPHQDHTDSSHGDHSDSGTSHNDFSDHSDYRYPKLVHNDGHYTLHSDYYSTPEARSHLDTNETAGPNPAYINSKHFDANGHVDVPHSDAPHSDSHGDSPHVDQAAKNSHGDFTDTSHTDTPHTDIPHVDAAHTDSHGDSHGDTPHGDEPVYVGY
jgi:hypothetical protein